MLQPILVVESAERLPAVELQSLLKLAKELTDKQLGRFIFVFAPSDKLHDVRGQSSMSRATVVDVGELSEAATVDYLASKGCPRERAAVLFNVVGGQLLRLVDNQLASDFCAGAITSHQVERSLFADVEALVRSLGWEVGTDRVCTALRKLVVGGNPDPELLPVCRLLVKANLARTSLKRKGIVVDDKVVKDYALRSCVDTERLPLLPA